jgi:hypothetical protein
MTDTRIIAAGALAVTAAAVIGILRLGPWVVDRIEAAAAHIDGLVGV